MCMVCSILKYVVYLVYVVYGHREEYGKCMYGHMCQVNIVCSVCCVSNGVYPQINDSMRWGRR